MEVFIASRLSNGNGLFPTEIHLNDFSVNIVKPGLIASEEKDMPYNKITSTKIISPIFGFTKIVFSCIGLDEIMVEGFERRYAEEIKRLVEIRRR